MNRIGTNIVAAAVLMASSAAYADNGDTYNASNNTLTIPSVTVGDATYTNVVIGVTPQNIISVGGVTTPQPVAFTTLDSSWNSGISTAQNAVIRDQAAWSNLWAKHTSHFVSPGPVLPSVDFNTNMVLGVFAGSYSNGCYSMSITRVTQYNSNLTVEYQIPPIPAGVGCAAVVVSLAQLILVPKSSGSVIFVQK